MANTQITNFPTEKAELAQKNNDAPPGEKPNGKFEEKQFLTENFEDEFDLTEISDPPNSHMQDVVNNDTPKTRSGRPYAGGTQKNGSLFRNFLLAHWLAQMWHRTCLEAEMRSLLTRKHT